MIILPLMIKDVTVNVTANLKNIEVQKNVLDSGAKGLHASDVVVGKARLSSYIGDEVISDPTIVTNFIRKNINYNNDINYVEVNTKNYDNSDFYDIYRLPLPANNPNEVTDYIYGMIINNIRLSNPLELKSGKISLQTLGFDKIFNAEFINRVMLLKNKSINSLYLRNELIKEGYNKQIEILDFFNSLDYEIKDSDVILTSELDSVITFFNTTKNERKTLTNYKNIASTNYEHYMSLAAFNNLVYNKNLEWPVLTEEQQKILIRKLNSNRRVA